MKQDSVMCQRRQKSCREVAVHGLSKFGGRTDPKHQGHAESHIRIAGEVEIDLEREAESRLPCLGNGYRPPWSPDRRSD